MTHEAWFIESKTITVTSITPITSSDNKVLLSVAKLTSPLSLSFLATIPLIKRAALLLQHFCWPQRFHRNRGRKLNLCESKEWQCMMTILDSFFEWDYLITTALLHYLATFIFELPPEENEMQVSMRKEKAELCNQWVK